MKWCVRGFGYGISAVIILLLIISCKQESKPALNQTGEGYRIASPFLSPDKKKIILSVSKNNSAQLSIYNIETGKMFRFSPTKNKFHFAPAFSRDGKKIAFTSGAGKNINVFIMNSDMTNIKQLSHTYNAPDNYDKKGNKVVHINALPSFSPDGKRIIFIRSEVERKRALGGRMLSHWDVWELNIETGIENRLTKYKFYTIGRPFFLKDGKRFIFSGDGAKPSNGSNYDFQKKYEFLNQNNVIFIMDGMNNNLEPILKNGWYSVAPTISENNEIVFISESTEMEGKRGPFKYDLYIKKESKIKKITHAQFKNINEPYLSIDGKMIVFWGNMESEENVSLWTININNDLYDLKKLKLPVWDEITEILSK